MINRRNTTIETSTIYRSRSWSAFLTNVPALLLGFALILASCQDQPLDTDGTVRLDTTIVRTVDTIVINETDTLFITRVDTTFVTVNDTIRVEITKRDTIRDTVFRDRIDTIEVPGGRERFRAARLVLNGLDMSTGSVRIDSFSVDISKWIHYTVIDSAGDLSGIAMTLSLGMPPRFQEIDLALGRGSVPYTLEGLALFIPSFRPNGINSDAFELEDHPYDFSAREPRHGGILMAYRRGEDGEILNAWTGNRFEITTPRPGEYRSRGTFRIHSVDRQRRRLFGNVIGVIYLPDEQNGVSAVLPVELRIEFELGW